MATFTLPIKYLFIGIFLILTAFFLLEYRVVGQAVYGDGRYYYAFTRSLYFDRNIDISDEMAHQYSPVNNNSPTIFGHVPELSGKTKQVTYSFSLGASVIWLPFYFLADTVVIFLNSVGVPVVRNGYSDVYQIIVGLGNILFGVAGLFLLFRILQGFFPAKVVMPTLILLIFATNLLYYGGIDVINSHPFSFFGSTLLLWLFLRYSKTGEMRLLFLQGITGGLLMANRTQDILLFLLPLLGVYLFQKKKQTAVRLAEKYLLLIFGFFVGYLPQLVILSLGQGRLMLFPHTDQAFTYPHYFLGILFDPKLGIFFYMPIFLVGVVGLILLYRKHRSIVLLFGLAIFLYYLLIASWVGWHQAAYTMRYFIALLPFISFGIAEVISRLTKRYSPSFLYIVIGLFICHQLMMILGFKLFWQDPTVIGGEVSRSGELKTELIREAGKVFP